MHPPVLPDSWLDRLWQALRANYGAEFDRQWTAPHGVDPAAYVRDMRAYWARELAPFGNHPDAIRHALSALPERPPNLPQFIALCRSAPQPYTPPALPKPKTPADKAKLAEVMAIIKRPRDGHPKAWAERLRNREASGERLGVVQRQFWREALRDEQPTDAEVR